MSRRIVIVFAVAAFCTLAIGQDRETKVRNDKKDLADDKIWVYNDLPRATAEAKKANKPLFVVLRCIPCEACSQFDKELLADDNEVKDLLDRFVCVRIVQANGLDLKTFQFDYDQSFHAFFMNADKTIYGRFGTRSEKKEKEDMTMAGLREAMLAALNIHASYPNNKELLAGKQGRPTSASVPEKLFGLKDKFTSQLDYEGNVVQSCIHCHQIRDAERMELRHEKKPIPAAVLFPYPLPEAIGLSMDPTKRATIARVADGSAAAKAGLQAGDEMLAVAGQAIVSTADIQWALHHAPAEGKLPILIKRELQQVSIPLAAGWREATNISWRPTSWDLRRMATGGLLLEDLSNAERKKRDLAEDGLALRVKHVGQYGDHAAAKNAGFRQEDVIVQVGDDTARKTESQFIAATLKHPRGEKLPVKVRRGKETVDLKLPLQ